MAEWLSRDTMSCSSTIVYNSYSLQHRLSLSQVAIESCNVAIESCNVALEL